ncbi:adenine deaminase [Virgibacillus salexigens]|uniref:Adenine deaminase n=2 Tax=Virgibacillus TaxID=84406 RepID=A0A024QFF7_9BACI|nr:MULTISPECIES: adenine deaminase [Virgibacillus]GGJ71661.1 adenine deaminase [Virgibacillus kapii]CDQ41234.1 Adenine deaminase [Virgibacillus massiliensis]
MSDKTFINKIQVSSGRELADIVIKNGKIVNVFSSEIMEGDLAIKDGYIVGIGEYEGKKVIDANHRYISPAFIDGHVHIESSMVTPSEFAKVQLVHGVTTMICDPHEIANVAGVKGIEYMLKSVLDLPFDYYFMLPSCVPATPFEHAGATVTSEGLLPLYDYDHVLGLAEVMNFPGVENADKDMIDKLVTAKNRGKKIDGHAAGLFGKQLDVYMTAGIRTDHEGTTVDEANERLQKGMYVMIREGTAAKDFRQLIQVVNERNARRFLFVTDDRHLDDIIKEGSIDHMARMTIEEGIDPITSIQMATLNAAECFGLNEHGAIAPGYKANFLFLDDLSSLHISSVYKDGICVVNNGEIKVDLESVSPPSELMDSINFHPIKEADLSIPLLGESANVIELIPNSIATNHLIESVPTNNEQHFIPSIERDLLKLAVVERHDATGNIGLGILKGLGLQAGAIATTVAHDSHNLIIAGANDPDMVLAAKTIQTIQGGLVVVNAGEVIATIALPVAGLMSLDSYEQVNTKLEEISLALQWIGVKKDFNPFLTLSFLALPVIPELKLTDQGLFDNRKFKHISVDVLNHPIE